MGCGWCFRQGIECDPRRHTCLIRREDDLHQYVSKWVWPAMHESAAKVFETGSFQAKASQTLSVAPVLAKYMKDVVPPGAMPEPVSSFILCCKALDMVIASSRGLVGHREYEESVLEHLEAHQKSYGDSWWVYKHHMALHLPDMAQRFGPLNCFVHERKHKLTKRFCKDHVCKKRPEKALMLQLVAQHFYDMQDWCLTVGLQDAKPADKSLVEVIHRLRPGTHTVFASIKATSKEWGLTARGDFVLMGPDRQHSIGHVYFHVDCDPGTATASGPLTLIALFLPQRVQRDRKSSQYLINDDTRPVLVPTSELKCATTYRRNDDRLTVLWPIDYQLKFKDA